MLFGQYPKKQITPCLKDPMYRFVIKNDPISLYGKVKNCRENEQLEDN